MVGIGPETSAPQSKSAIEEREGVDNKCHFYNLRLVLPTHYKAMT